MVVGSRGYGPHTAVLLGSVSGHVVRDAACPVIVVPRGIKSPLEELSPDHERAGGLRQVGRPSHFALLRDHEPARRLARRLERSQPATAGDDRIALLTYWYRGLRGLAPARRGQRPARRVEPPRRRLPSADRLDSRRADGLSRRVATASAEAGTSSEELRGIGRALGAHLNRQEREASPAVSSSRRSTPTRSKRSTRRSTSCVASSGAGPLRPLQLQPDQETSMSAPAATARWAYDFAEGSRDMRELLGGKGADIAEMTRVLGPELVPAGFTITTEACVAYMRAGEVPDGLGEAVDAAIARLEAQAGKRFGDPRRPAARVRAQRRPRLHAGHDGHGPQPRPQRRVGRRPGRAHRPRSLRLGLLPPPRADVRRRGLRRPRRAVRGRDRRDEDRARRAPGHRARHRSADRAHAARSRRSTTSRRIRASSSSARSVRGVRLLDGRPRRRVPAHQRHPRRLGHGRQRPADGLREQGATLGLRCRLLPRRGHGRARAERRLPDRRPGRGRRVRRADAARPGRAGARGCPTSTRS